MSPAQPDGPDPVDDATGSPEPGGPGSRGGAPVWREVVRWALLGTLLVVLAVLVDVARTGVTPLNLVQPGADGPSARVFAEDFPGVTLPDGLGLDGQQFYVVARNPWHLDELVPALDRPRYRLQRPLLSWLAWTLHPTGGGEGLIAALAAVGVLATFGGSVATGLLAARLGGPAWSPLVFALLPGTWLSLRVTTADTLALALTVAAFALALGAGAPRARRAGAWAAGALAAATGAVLARETSLVSLAGWVASRRDRLAVALVVVPGAVAGAWWWWLRGHVPVGSGRVAELVVPFSALPGMVERWVGEAEVWGFVAFVAAVGAAVAGLVRRGWRHPLAGPLAANLAVVPFLDADVLANSFGSPRSLAPLLLFGLLVWVCPGSPVPAAPTSGGPRPGDPAGTVAPSREP